jgi:hypothetical protein
MKSKLTELKAEYENRLFFYKDGNDRYVAYSVDQVGRFTGKIFCKDSLKELKRTIEIFLDRPAATKPDYSSLLSRPRPLLLQ